MNAVTTNQSRWSPPEAIGRSGVPEDSFFLRFFPHCRSDSLDGYLAEVAARLPERGRVLDLGCGKNTQLAPFRTAEREVWGADFQEHPQLAHPQWFRRLAPAGSVPFPDATFDVVAACWVLEHVERPVEFLREVARVLRPGGWLVALTPNGQHYATWLIRLFEALPHRLSQGIIRWLYGRAPHDTFRTHYLLNTPARLRKAGRVASLELTGRIGFPNPDYFSFFPPLRRAAVVADWALERAWPGLGQLYVVFTLRKSDLADAQTRAA
jgi:SAM-dependent methyltransferase